MTTTLNASNSGSGGLVATADASGVLALQTAGTTAVTIDTSQRTAFVAGTAALPAITTIGDTNTGIFFPAADTIAFAEGGAEAMRIDSSGNVGIGTTSPSSAISVSRSTGEAVISITNAGSASSWLTLAPSSSGSAYIHNTSNAATIFTTNGAERMRIDSSGNVGIGTSSPGVKLDVVGQIRASGSVVSANDFIGGGASGYAALYGNSTGGLVICRGSSSTNDIEFYTNNAERMRIDSSGNVGIGGITPGSNPKLSLYGGIRFLANEAASATYTGIGSIASDTVSISTSGSERMRIDTSGNVFIGTATPIGGDSGRLSVDVGGGLALLANRTGDGNIVRFYRAGSNVGNINVTAGGTAYNTSSDCRLKNSIAPMTDALAKVSLLKPCTYKWNADNSDGQGFIAHELAEVVPNCVTGEKDAVETYTDEDGNEATRPAYQSIDTSFLVATLTAAIQEQQALITSLTARIAALEGTPA